MQSKFLKIINGTAINTFGTIFVSILSFILIPIIIGKVGIEKFGYIAFLNLFSALGFFSIFGLGVPQAVVRYVSQYNTEENFNDSNSLIIFSIIFLLFVASLISSLIYFSSSFIVSNFISVSLDDYDQLRFLLILTTAALLFQLPSLVLRSSLEGLLLFKQVQIVIISTELLKFVLVIFFLDFLAYDYEYVIYSTLISSFVCFLIFLILLSVKHRGFSFLSVNPRIIGKEKFYAFNIFLGQFFSQIYINIDKFLVSIFLTPAALGSLEVLTKLPILINKFLGLSVSTIIPMVGSTQSDQLDKFSKELFYKGFRWFSSFITPVILALIFYSEEFLLIWIGNEVSELHDILSLILVWCLLTTLSFGGNIVYGREEGIKEMTIYRILHCLLKVGAIYFFIKDYGLYAVAISYLISNLSLIYVIGVFRRYIFIDVRAFLSEFIKILLCGFPSLMLGLLLTNYIAIGNFLVLLIAFLVWQIPYWIMLYFIVLKPDDKLRLKSILYL